MNRNIDMSLKYSAFGFKLGMIMTSYSPPLSDRGSKWRGWKEERYFKAAAPQGAQAQCSAVPPKHCHSVSKGQAPQSPGSAGESPADPGLHVVLLI